MKEGEKPDFSCPKCRCEDQEVIDCDCSASVLKCKKCGHKHTVFHDYDGE